MMLEVYPRETGVRQGCRDEPAVWGVQKSSQSSRNRLSKEEYALVPSIVFMYSILKIIPYLLIKSKEAKERREDRHCKNTAKPAFLFALRKGKIFIQIWRFVYNLYIVS